MGCFDAETALAYLSGHMANPEAQDCADHISHCESCKHLVEETSELVDNTRRLLLMIEYPLTAADVPSAASLRTRAEHRRTFLRLPVRPVSTENPSAEDVEDYEFLKAATARVSWLQSVRETTSRMAEFLSGKRAWVMSGVATAALAAVIATAVLLQPSPGAPSGATILRRSLAAEQTIATRPDQVVHRVITLEQRSGDQVIARRRIETWESAGKRVRATRMYGDKGELVAGEWLKSDSSRILFQKARLTTVARRQQNPAAEDAIWQITPSAEGFISVTGDSDRVTVEERPSVYVLRYQNQKEAPRSRVLNASLTLRRNDLHAVEQTIRVRADGRVIDYRLVETGFECKPAAQVMASVFDIDPLLLATHPVEAVKPVPSAVLIAGATASLETEVEVLGRLNTANVLGREEIAIQRTSAGTLSVEGIVETPERKQEILTALGAAIRYPAVKVQIDTVDEAMERLVQPRRPHIFLQDVEVVGKAPAADRDVRAYLKSRGVSDNSLETESERFAERILERSQQAKLHAQVLRDIAARFTPAQIDGMDVRARLEFHSMLRQHAEAYLRNASDLRRELSPLFASGRTQSVEHSFDAAQSDISKLTLHLADLANANDDAIGRSFRVTTQRGDDVPVASNRFWQAFSTSETLAAAVLQRVR